MLRRDLDYTLALKAMNRKYDYSSYKQKIDWIREYIPSAGISSDIIVGFPSETEDEFVYENDV